MPVVHARAGEFPTPEDLENIPVLVSAYFTEYPNPAVPAQRV